jgi:hypothetical protein
LFLSSSYCSTIAVALRGVIASEAKQSRFISGLLRHNMPRNDGVSFFYLYKHAKPRFTDALTARQFVRHNTRIAAPDLCPLLEAFSSEVDTGSRKENASK